MAVMLSLIVYWVTIFTLYFYNSEAAEIQLQNLKSIVDLQNLFKTTILFVPVPWTGDAQYDSLLPTLFEISKPKCGHTQDFDKNWLKFTLSCFQ